MNILAEERLHGNMDKRYNDGPKVLCVGLSRTGTMSLWTAMNNILGFNPCLHMVECLFADNGVQMAREFMKAYDKKPVDFKRLLAPYKATCDIPANDFFPQIMQAYPQAKVVLATRDKHAWARSVNNSIGVWHTKPPFAPVWLGAMPCIRDQRDVARRWHFLASIDPPRNLNIDPDYMDRWLEHVKQNVPAEKLLIWNVRDGFEPLCTFLDVPKPKIPFPRINDTEDMMALVKCMTFLCHTVTLSWAAGTALTAANIYHILRPLPVSSTRLLCSRIGAGLCLSLGVFAQLNSPVLLRNVIGPMVAITKRLPRRRICLSIIATTLGSLSSLLCYRAI